MNKLPTNWKEYSFKDFCDITSSKRIFYREYVKYGVPFYRSKEIIAKSNGRELNDYLYISKDRFEEIKNKYGIPINGDILITAVGTYGIPYLINEDGDFYFKDGNLIRLKNIKNTAYSKFLFYWLKSEEAKNKIEKIIIGSVQKALTIDAMKNIKLNLPPLAEQKGIASILSSLDDKIELNNKTNRILEEMAQSIFNEWFINFNFPNEDGKPYKKSGGEMIDSELGKIPKGWKVGILGDIISIESGKRPNVSSKNITTEYNIPIYGASNKIGYTNSILFNEKILITGRVGTHGIVQRINFPCWVSDNTFVIRSTFYEYTYQNLKRIDYINLNRGTTQSLIVQSDIKKLKVLLNDKIINQYENLTSSFWNLWHKNIFENERLSGIRDILLPKLMSGEIRIDKNE